MDRAAAARTRPEKKISKFAHSLSIVMPALVAGIHVFA
jgi:hypothetical protein